MIRLFCIFCVWILAKIFYRHKVYGKKHLPKGAALIASNHCSFLDPPLIGISYPGKVHFLGRASLFRKPAFAFLIRRLNTHPVDPGKGNLSTFKLILRLMKKGNKVVLFPEGRRSRTGELLKGQLGVGMLVLKSHCKVIPVYLHGTFALWDPKKRFPSLFGHRTACVFGRALDFSHLIENGEKKESQQEIADEIMRVIGVLKEWYINGAKGPIP